MSFSSWEVDVFSLTVGLGRLLMSFVAVEALELEKGSFMLNDERQRCGGKSERAPGMAECSG